MSKIIIYILIYFFIYKNLAFYPNSYCSYFNLFALLCCLFNIKNIKIYKKIKKIFIPVLGMGFIYILSLLINEQYFSNNPLKIFIFRLFLDINFIIFLNKNLNVEIDKKYIIFFKGVIYSTTIDILLGLLRFKFYLIDKIFLKIFPPRDNIISDILEQKVRLMGLGGYFFGGGVILSVSLILISFLLTNIKVNKKERLKLKLLYCFNLVFGILISRTTILGVILSLYYFLYSKKNKLIIVKKIIINVIILIFILWIIYINLNINIRNNIYKFLYIQGIGSVKKLLEMYKIFPRNWKTFIIGDGIWENQDGSYYMQIDVGYLRMIFFNGILGMLFKIFFNYKLTCIKDIKLKELSNIMFLLFLILNLKGDILYLSISLYLYIFYLLYNKYQKE